MLKLNSIDKFKVFITRTKIYLISYKQKTVYQYDKVLQKEAMKLLHYYEALNMLISLLH